MKGSIILIIFAGIVLFSCKSEVPPSEETQALFKTIEWITGEWTFNNEAKGQVTVETWKKTGEFELSGSGVTREGDKVVFEEKLNVKIKDDAVYYVVDFDAKGGPVWFKVIESDGNYFLAENPENDFPKQFRYTNIDDGHRARIELMGGKRIIMNYFRTK